jgi:putative transposase
MDMKPSRFTEEQIIGILREQEAGAKSGDLCPEGSGRRQRQAQEAVAEAMLNNPMLKDVASKNGDARRKAGTPLICGANLR